MFNRFCTRLAWRADHSGCAAFLLMVGYLWVLPIGNTAALRNLFFFALLGITFWAAWQRRLKLHLPLAKAWGIYAAVAALSLLYALDPVYSLGEIKVEIIYAMLVLLLGASWVRDTQTLSRLIWLVVIGNAFLVGYAVIHGVMLQMAAQQTITAGSFQVGVGKFSTYLILVIPFIAVQCLLAPAGTWPRRLLLGLLIANLIALYITGNRAGWLATIASQLLLAALLLYRGALPPTARKKLLWVTAFFTALSASLLVVSLVQKSPAATAEQTQQMLNADVRWSLWRYTLEQNIAKRPLSGGGFGQEAFTKLNPEFRKANSMLWHAHNMFLNKGVQMGIPGILAFCLLLAAALRAMWPPQQENETAVVSYAYAGVAMLAATLVKNLTDDFFVRDTGWLFWLLAGAVIGTLQGRRDKNGAA